MGYPSFLLLLLACSLQVTFCKSVLNLNPDLNRARRETWVLKDNEWIRVNRAHPSAVKEKRSVEVEDQGMDQDQDEYLEVEDNDMNEDYSTATPEHGDENIGQEQDTMTMESGLNRLINFCTLAPLLPCWNIG